MQSVIRDVIAVHFRVLAALTGWHDLPDDDQLLDA